LFVELSWAEEKERRVERRRGYRGKKWMAKVKGKK
jgi:hypothetical protein